MPKLTEHQRCLILADYLDGVPYKEIAARHGVNINYIGALVSRSNITKRRYRPKKYKKFRWRQNANS